MRRVDKLKANWIETEYEKAPQVAGNRSQRATGNGQTEPITKRTSSMHARIWVGERDRASHSMSFVSIGLQADWTTALKAQLTCVWVRVSVSERADRGSYAVRAAEVSLDFILEFVIYMGSGWELVKHSSMARTSNGCHHKSQHLQFQMPHSGQKTNNNPYVDICFTIFI